MRFVLLVILVILIRHNYKFYQRLIIKRQLMMKDNIALVSTFIVLIMILFAVPFHWINFVIVVLIWSVLFSGIMSQGLTEEGVQYFEGLKVAPALVPYDKVGILSWESMKSNRQRVIMKIPKRQITQVFNNEDMPVVKQRVKTIK